MQHRCVLEDPMLGIITENDHKLGLCICNRCTCGKHSCAYKGLFASLPLKLHSTYESDFIRTEAKVKPTEMTFPTPSSPKWQFTGESSYKLAYIKHDSTPNPRFSSSPLRPAPISGTLRSSYTKDFIHLKPEKVESFSPLTHSVTPGGFKFSEGTTYKTFFHPKLKAEKTKTFNRAEAKLFVDPNNYLQTSHKRDYIKLERSEGKETKLPDLISSPEKMIYLKSSAHRDYAASMSPVKNLPRRLAAIRGFN
jgi:hypothetical protein